MTQLLLGQGKLYSAPRDANGQPLAQRWFGIVSAAKLGLKVTKADMHESHTGKRTKIKSVVVSQEASIDLTLQEINSGNLVIGTSGTATKLPSGSISGEVLPGNLVAGDRVSLKYPTVTNVVITDSAGTPVTVSATKYKVDADFGSIVFTDVGSYQQPFKAAYTHGPLDSVSMLSALQSEMYLRYEGVNIGEGGTPIIVELYKVQAEPFKDLALISDKFADMNISAEVLTDTSRPTDPEIGQFGRILQVSSA